MGFWGFGEMGVLHFTSRGVEQIDTVDITGVVGFLTPLL